MTEIHHNREGEAEEIVNLDALGACIDALCESSSGVDYRRVIFACGKFVWDENIDLKKLEQLIEILKPKIESSHAEHYFLIVMRNIAIELKVRKARENEASKKSNTSTHETARSIPAVSKLRTAIRKLLSRFSREPKPNGSEVVA